MKTAMLLLGASMLLVVGYVVVSVRHATTDKVLYIARECYMPNDDVAALTFLDHQQQRSRSISFSIKGRFSAVYLGRFTDIAVDWTRIVAIHTRAYKTDVSLVRFAVEFKPETRIRPSTFEFGVVQKACLRRIEARYGKYLTFVSH